MYSYQGDIPNYRMKAFMIQDMQLKIFMCSVGEEAELCFYLYHKEGRYVSEEYPSYNSI
jgi:hypothetical protein